jgi:tetratricopeptide (TPR) repeat protein
MKPAFLSFSLGGDAAARQFVRQLLGRLRDQGLDVWMYESAGGAIPPGASIADACRRKIDDAGVFLVYLTDRALDSAFVQLEIAHALGRAARGSLVVLPLLRTAIPPAQWPEAIAPLREVMAVAVAPERPDALERALHSVCDRLDLEYRPPAPFSPRLPLRQRTASELASSTSRSGYDAADFHTLLHKCDLAAAAMEEERYADARRLLDSMLVDVELLYGTTVYYPHVVYGMALLGEAHQGRRPIAEAEGHFDRVIAGGDPRLDANAFVGRAHARVALDRFADALADYERAESLLEEPDPAVLYSRVRLQVTGGLTLERSALDQMSTSLRDGTPARMPGDLSRLRSSLALGYAYVGDSRIAWREWQQVEDRQAVFPELVTDLCDQLDRTSARERLPVAREMALTISADYLERRSNLSPLDRFPLEHLRARLLSGVGELAQARAILGRLSDQFPLAPIVAVDAAMYAIDARDAADAGRRCRAVISLHDHTQCHPPLAAADFNYAAGQALWLLGREGEARECFRRGGHPESAWYGTTMPTYFGAAAEAGDCG